MYRIGPKTLIQSERERKLFNFSFSNSTSIRLDLVYDGGSDWYVLNRDFVHYVTYGNDQMINGLRHVFKYSLLPCEVNFILFHHRFRRWIEEMIDFAFWFCFCFQSFFHTVLSNSIYCDSYIRSNLRFVHWNRDRGCKCQHKNVVDWCGCSPLVYRSSDLNILNVSWIKINMDSSHLRIDSIFTGHYR